MIGKNLAYREFESKFYKLYLLDTGCYLPPRPAHHYVLAGSLDTVDSGVDLHKWVDVGTSHLQPSYGLLVQSSVTQPITELGQLLLSGE